MVNLADFVLCREFATNPLAIQVLSEGLFTHFLFFAPVVFSNDILPIILGSFYSFEIVLIFLSLRDIEPVYQSFPGFL